MAKAYLYARTSVARTRKLFVAVKTHDDRSVTVEVHDRDRAELLAEIYVDVKSDDGRPRVVINDYVVAPDTDDPTHTLTLFEEV